MILPFPDDEELKALFDVLYHVSFLTEESRHLAVRVAYLPPDLPNEQMRGQLNLHDSPVKFTSPILFTAAEVLRLAPAIEPTQSILVVCATSAVNIESDQSPLAIWGIINLGTNWWRLLTGRDTGAVAPPNLLTISTFASGNLTASTLGQVIFRLQGGRLMGVPLDNLGDGSIGQFLQDTVQELYGDVIKKLDVKRFDTRADSDRHPRRQYFRALSNIINLAKERHHGGTFIVLPDDIGINDRRLRDRLLIKYTLESPNIWELLIKECEAHKRYYDALFPEREANPNSFSTLTSKDNASAEDLKALINWEQRHERAEDNIFELENFISTLSAIDGAVVLTKKLKVLGFGAEIIASSPSLETVKMANDPLGDSYIERPITTFGTRHRSAIRLCSSFEDCIAFVISQDGFVRAIKGVGSNLFVWDYLPEAGLSL